MSENLAWEEGWVCCPSSLVHSSASCCSGQLLSASPGLSLVFSQASCLLLVLAVSSKEKGTAALEGIWNLTLTTPEEPESIMTLCSRICSHLGGAQTFDLADC